MTVPTAAPPTTSASAAQHSKSENSPTAEASDVRGGQKTKNDTDPPLSAAPEGVNGELSLDRQRIDLVVRGSLAPAPAQEKPGPHWVVTLATVLLEFLRAVAWPLLALTFFVMFSEPVSQTIKLIPVKLEKSSKGSVGPLTWEMQQQAREQGGSDLAGRVATLSPPAIEALIGTVRDGTMVLPSTFANREKPTFAFPTKDKLDGLIELERTGLLKFREPLDNYLQFVETAFERESSIHGDREAFVATRPLSPAELQRISQQSYELTDRGKQALDAIVAAIGEQLRAE